MTSDELIKMYGKEFGADLNDMDVKAIKILVVQNLRQFVFHYVMSNERGL